MRASTRFVLLVCLASTAAWREARDVVDAATHNDEGSVVAATAAADPTKEEETAPVVLPPSERDIHRQTQATPSSFTMNFDFIRTVLQDSAPVGNYYNGSRGGPSYGVTFGADAVALPPGLEGVPSPTDVLKFTDQFDTYVTAVAGFVGLSFYYVSLELSMKIIVYDGPGGTGNVLNFTTLPSTSLVIPWPKVTVPFPGVAKSIRFFGDTSYFFLDDMTLTPAPSCTKTRYFLWNPKTNRQVRELKNNTISCITVPYNIEARPCRNPQRLPVVLTLRNATNGVVKTQRDFDAPFFLWGDNPETGDVLPSKKPLPKGAYSLTSTIGGAVETIKFKTNCAPQ